MNLSPLIQNKLQGEHPSWYIPLETVRHQSWIPRVGITPYPFHFQSNPFDAVPTIENNEAGWSSRVLKPPRVLPRPVYPEHKWQAACNTIYTSDKSGQQSCINMYR